MYNYNLDQFTHKQIKVRRAFMKVWELLGPGYNQKTPEKMRLILFFL